jgi:hypothetical protein
MEAYTIPVERTKDLQELLDKFGVSKEDYVYADRNKDGYIYFVQLNGLDYISNSGFTSEYWRFSEAYEKLKSK